jgi:hypothetical protein
VSRSLAFAFSATVPRGGSILRLTFVRIWYLHMVHDITILSETDQAVASLW